MPTSIPSADPLITHDESESSGLTVLDTDIGGGPDDFVALVIAARLIPDLLVVTADEVGGLRARLARRVLDSLGRGDVEVIEGIDLGHRRLFLPDPGQTVPAYVLPGVEELEDRRHELADALYERIVNTEGPVCWVGCGPMSNLTALLLATPEVAEQITVWQTGGWLDHHYDLEASEHNLHTDTLAAGLALRILPTPRLVLADHTHHREIRVTTDWTLIHALDSDTAPDWARLLSAHVHRWIARGHHGFCLHAPLTLSVALGQPFVVFAPAHVRIGDDARLYRDPYGRPTRVSNTVDYSGFVTWVSELLSW
ncbi:nucleoside hydrolase [Nocardia noduli]|uniref:nucleoside hydrolase n=1 Tax=Nocardia noduli TaxID=2815722 RepID=UPI001C23053E|nr:nucleoside hydrolase [Nocardia noduli]